MSEKWYVRDTMQTLMGDPVAFAVDFSETECVADVHGEDDKAHARANLIAAAPTGYYLIARAVADRINEQWLIDARAYLEAVNGNS